MIITIARKPFPSSVSQAIILFGVGGINIDASRISTNPDCDDMLRSVARQPRISQTWEQGSGFKNEKNHLTGVRVDGRFPSNVILQHHPACTPQGNTSPTKKPYTYEGNTYQVQGFVPSCKPVAPSNYNDSDAHSVYECVCTCPVFELDHKSNTHSAGGKRGSGLAKQDNAGSLFLGDKGSPNNGMRFGDSGTASRFFKQCKAKT